LTSTKQARDPKFSLLANETISTTTYRLIGGHTHLTGLSISGGSGVGVVGVLKYLLCILLAKGLSRAPKQTRKAVSESEYISYSLHLVQIKAIGHRGHASLEVVISYNVINATSTVHPFICSSIQPTNIFPGFFAKHPCPSISARERKRPHYR